ncbi:hypothetical protein HSX10_14700 [Winogradskyella undariae]|uniref:hypothetical protein n=1 Tax=Winogradskyella TaxID=286104 RepID=UPI00156AB82F|nr:MULTISPECIES: hypothetical protein [Winogradskyella]NRR92820.1 hypothetical protein [Winogradskyella undariae]QXP79856.1 hypothetical protein H0I32_04235 [Winogradskyella sp. HaHa_3_26]
MKKQVLMHGIAAVLLSLLLYKFASFTIGNSVFIGFGTAFLGILYVMNKSKK